MTVTKEAKILKDPTVAWKGEHVTELDLVPYEKYISLEDSQGADLFEGPTLELHRRPSPGTLTGVGLRGAPKRRISSPFQDGFWQLSLP